MEKNLASSRIGRGMIDSYYRYSPPVARYIESRDGVRALVRIALIPVLAFSYMMVNSGFIVTVMLAIG